LKILVIDKTNSEQAHVDEFRALIDYIWFEPIGWYESD